MKRKIFSLLVAVILLAGKAYTQVTISGTNPVNTNDVDVYYADLSYDPCHYGYIDLSWIVDGGNIISQNLNPAMGPVFVQVQWTASPGYAASIQLYGAYAPPPPGFPAYCFIGFPELLSQFNLMIGKVTITPESQYVAWYAANAVPVCVDLPGVTVNSWQWQTSYNPSGPWTDLGTSSACINLISITENKYYRCILSTTVGTYTSPVAFVGYLELYPGAIAANIPLTLNTAINLQQSPATGGYCSGNFQYIWEQSIDDGPWMQVGAAVNYPAGQTLQSKIAIRRRVKCGPDELVTNTIVLTPEYTTGDFENRNYIRETSVQKRGVVSWYQADAQAIGDKFQQTTYLDGLGRSIQTVVKGIGPATGGGWKDMVTHYEYDAAGRTIKEFLPYVSSENAGKFKIDAAAAQPAYLTVFFGEPANAPTYGMRVLESSPLSRLRESLAPGASWGGANKGVKTVDDFNMQNEEVRIWNLDYIAGALPVNNSAAVYATGTLSRITTTDENNLAVISYSDRSGNLILKKVQQVNTGQSLTHAGWSCTYYVYDDKGQLRFIISPKAVEWLDGHSWSLTQEIVDELCFKYEYDALKRMIVKKQPGIGEERLVYDLNHRVVLTQQANQDKVNNTALVKNQWLFILYDDLDRPVAKGIMENDADRATMQGYVNQISTGLIQNVSAFVGTGYATVRSQYPVAGHNGTGNTIPGTTNVTFNAVEHYDNYTYLGAKAFNNTYTLAYSPGAANVEATNTTQRNTGLVTGRKIRIIDGDNNNLNDNFLFSTMYYDEEGRLVESNGDNANRYNGAGMDYSVYQYDFGGKHMSSFNSHTPDGSTIYTIISKNEYDLIGRLAATSANYNNSFFKKLAEYGYDELGNVKAKRIAPNGPGDEMELLNYSYNIRGWMTGINKDYALDNNNYNQWDHYFGIYLGFDNTANALITVQLNGSLGGVAWKSQGDNTPRKFDFIYDPLGRLTQATFKQRKKPADANWQSTEIDFSTTVEYEDANGNLKSMKHMGVMPGVNAGIVVDDLHYSYLPTTISGLTGNKLRQVDESGTLGNNNGLLGDFKEVNSTQDYFYDANGNLVKDLNRNIKNGSAQGVIYNFLNKPEKIFIEGKSVVEFSYNTAGEAIRKKVTYADNSILITSYMDAYVYEQFIPAGGGGTGDQLQYITHEEGRLKIITPHTRTANNDYELNSGTAGISNWPGGKQAVFEYFIKDHQGSMRMGLTEEIQKEYYVATMESNPGATATSEEQLFGQVDPLTGTPSAANELQQTRITSQLIWPGNSTDVVKLTALDPNKVLGPNMILKVMAGDIIHSNVKYYYAGTGNNGSNPLLNNLVGSLVNALAGSKATEIMKTQSAVIGGGLNPNIPFTDFLQGHNQVNNRPKAFLNIVFFDEQFRFVEYDPVQSTTGSNFAPVGTNPNSTIVMQQRAPKNGWAFVFLSNESDEAVYFDDLAVTQEHSPMLEENHYYPFGQKMAGISGRAYNKLKNKHNYQGQYSEDEEETGWEQFALRMYDPQIGRWTGADPYAQFASPYIGMGNNPVNGIDPNGGDFFNNNGTVVGSLVGFAVGVYLSAKKDNPAYAFGGVILGGAIGSMYGAERINFYVGPNWKMVKDDIKKHSVFTSAYFASYIKSLAMKVLSLGKLRTIHGQSPVKINEKINNVFKRHPGSMTGTLFSDFHSDDYGEGPLDASAFRSISHHFDQNSVVLLGNCFEGGTEGLIAIATDDGVDYKEKEDPTVPELSEALHGATVIGYERLNNNLLMLITGSFLGGNVKINGDGVADYDLKHRITQNGKTYNHILAIPHITNSGKITLNQISEQRAQRLRERWAKPTNNILIILKAIFLPVR
jgi:RHS repeat-associated protein